VSDSSTSSSGGIGLAGALFLLFTGLKLGGVHPVTDWSWWWVTSPLWGTAAAVAAILAICAVIIGVVEILK
jgi:hypothetical protein